MTNNITILHSKSHKPVINPPNTSINHKSETRHRPAKHVTKTDTSTIESPEPPDSNMDQK